MLIQALLMSLMAFQSGDAYVLILSNGKRMSVKAAPECSGRLCTVTLMNGEKTSLPRTMIDFDESTEVNLALREQRAAEQAAARAAAAEQAENSAPPPKPKPIRLTREETLPTYNGRDIVARSTEVEEGSVPVNTPAGEPIEEPQVTTYPKSGDPVYLTRETVTRYADRYRIETTVATELLGGVQTLMLELKVNFENETPFVSTVEIGKVSYRGPQVAVFEVPRTDEILRTSYNISYETVER